MEAVHNALGSITISKSERGMSMNRLFQMMGETSTWRGLLSILTAFGVVLQPEQASAIIAGGMAVIGLVNVFRKEVKNENPTSVDTPAG